MSLGRHPVCQGAHSLPSWVTGQLTQRLSSTVTHNVHTGMCAKVNVCAAKNYLKLKFLMPYHFQMFDLHTCLLRVWCKSLWYKGVVSRNRPGSCTSSCLVLKRIFLSLFSRCILDLGFCFVSIFFSFSLSLFKMTCLCTSGWPSTYNTAGDKFLLRESNLRTQAPSLTTLLIDHAPVITNFVFIAFAFSLL